MYVIEGWFSLQLCVLTKFVGFLKKLFLICLYLILINFYQESLVPSTTSSLSIFM